MTLPDHILLFNHNNKDNHVRISTYIKWRDEQKKDQIADFIYERHYQRYLKPFEFNNPMFKKEYKNGFSIMASCCLLIETLESFHRGWENSRNELNFLKFFTRDSNFHEFSVDDIPTQFYKNIRCGILHQGETTGGWSINRSKDKPLLNKVTKEINSVLFARKLKDSLQNYRELLKREEWTSQTWKNAREKMKSILKNCQ